VGCSPRPRRGGTRLSSSPMGIRGQHACAPRAHARAHFVQKRLKWAGSPENRMKGACSPNAPRHFVQKAKGAACLVSAHQFATWRYPCTFRGDPPAHPARPRAGARESWPLPPKWTRSAALAGIHEHRLRFGVGKPRLRKAAAPPRAAAVPAHSATAAGVAVVGPREETRNLRDVSDMSRTVPARAPRAL
jgi:hypothetical protein